MKKTSITIGGGNKNFFFSRSCLEILILNCLKNKQINKHIHIGRIPKLRIYFINLLLFFNGISKDKIEYKNQVKNLDLLLDYQGSIVISSAPITGALTILKCWKYRLPVLIYDPQNYFVNFTTFLKNEELVWVNFKTLSEKVDHLLKHYQKYSDEYYAHYLFLKDGKEITNDFLLKNAKKKYNYFYSRKLVYYKFNWTTIFYTLFSKSAYIIVKICLLVFFIYLQSIKKFIIQYALSSLNIFNKRK